MLFILFLRLILLFVEKKLKSVSYFLLKLKFATFLDYIPSSFSGIFSAIRRSVFKLFCTSKLTEKKSD
jgi:uncharacterized membrane protein